MEKKDVALKEENANVKGGSLIQWYIFENHV